MLCSKCGKEIPDGTKFCPECGFEQGDTSNTKNAESSPQKNEEKKFLEGYNILCIAGLILSCVSLIAGGLVGVAGAVVSYIGLKKCKEQNEKGREFAIIGIVLGGVMAAYLLISVITAIIVGTSAVSAVAGLY